MVLSKLLFFCWVVGRARLHVSSLKGESRFPIALRAPRMSALCIFKPDVLGARLSGSGPRGRGVFSGTPARHFSGRSAGPVRSLTVMLQCRGGVLGETLSLPLPPISSRSFCLLLWRSCSSSSRSSSEGNDPRALKGFVSVWDGLSSAFSCTAILREEPHPF